MVNTKNFLFSETHRSCHRHKNCAKFVIHTFTNNIVGFKKLSQTRTSFHTKFFGTVRQKKYMKVVIPALGLKLLDNAKKPPHDFFKIFF